MTPIEIQAQIDEFLRTGQYDILFPGWPGQNTLEAARRGSHALCEALIAETQRRQREVPAHDPIAIPGGDLTAFTRTKLTPMVRGLFPRSEFEQVLSLMERTVVFLTTDNIETLIRQTPYLNTAWKIASIYLDSIGAEPLDEDRRGIVGISVDTVCYVSMEYFHEADPFADYVVHEAAHVFHNTKRGTIGLKETRCREWLLPIDFRKRETFAYACETYSRILERARTPRERGAFAEQLRQQLPPPDDRVNPEEYVAILAEAAERRNGWKVILASCASKRR